MVIRPSQQGRSWNALSTGYRERLERNGISRRDYEQGASVQAARGHSAGEGKERLARQLDRLKEAAYGDRPSFNKRNSEKNTRKASASKIREAISRLDDTYEGDEPIDYDDADNPLKYH